MSNLSIIFREKVRLRLSEKDWSKSDLARALGQKPSGINTYLSDDGPSPGIDVLERWADALGCDPAWLIAQEEIIHAPTPTLSDDKLALISLILTLDKADFGTVETAVNAVSKRFKKNQASAISG